MISTHPTPSLSASYLYFLLWLVIVTIILGLIGMYFPKLVSQAVIVPYISAFYIMAQRYVKKYAVLPSKIQRWQLALGCIVIFWLYSIAAGVLGLWLTTGQLDFTPVREALGTGQFLTIFIGLFVFIDTILILFSYWFLGKPTAKMLAHYHG